jgi:hypothetical protein
MTCWLVCDGRRVAPLEVASLPWEVSRGWRGQDRAEGALLLETALLVHTFGMRFPIDVAFCDRGLRVLDVVTMARYRVARPRLRARATLEAPAGAFRDWQLMVGSRLEVAGCR